MARCVGLSCSQLGAGASQSGSRGAKICLSLGELRGFDNSQSLPLADQIAGLNEHIHYLTAKGREYGDSDVVSRRDLPFRLLFFRKGFDSNDGGIQPLPLIICGTKGSGSNNLRRIRLAPSSGPKFTDPPDSERRQPGQ